MAYTWGLTPLIVQKKSYNPPYLAQKVQEVGVLPGNDGTPDSVLHAPGQARKRVAFNGYAIGIAAYEALQNDLVDMKERIFADGNVSITMMIEDLPPATRDSDDIYAYNIILVEA